jgi:F420-dependent oxidoreductase-like protein
MGGGDGLPGPTDAWVTLAGLARETSTIRLGTLVTPATFRHPGVLAITVAQVDAMSGGRVELGLGSGWSAEEHAAYGLPFPELRERFDRLEEQLAVVTGLWSTPVGATFGFEGEHWTLVDSPALPKPVQDKVPVIVGGGGKRRTPRLAAAYADEFNMPFAPAEEVATAFDRVRRACEEVDRDPATLTLSAALVRCVGQDDAEVDRRAAAIGRDPDELRRNGVAGTPDQAAETVRRWADLGCGRLYLQVLDLHDLDHLRLVADSVLPQTA